MTSSPNHRGFTLIEVIIVMLVMGILAGMAMPMFTATDGSKLTSAADLMLADLSYAQVESISHSEDPRVVVFDTVNKAYSIATVSAPGTPITNPVGNLPYKTTFGKQRAAQLKGVSFGTLGVGGDNKIQFGIYGQLDQSTPATITLVCGTSKLDLSIDPVNGDVTVGQIYH